MKYFSAFSGIGGFDEGIKRVLPDAECVGYSEVDKYAIKIYKKHFPDRTNYGDISRINARTLPDFDMFCGGFPCQDLSIAGKRAGLCGARSGLFFEIVRIIREKQPRIVFLENVKGLFSSNNGWDFARILVELDESGYDVEWQCLNSKNFGVPQNRERVFIIGHLRGQSWKPVFPIGENSKRIDERSEQTQVIGCLSGGGHSGGMHSSRSLIVHNMQPRSPNRPSASNGGSGHLTRDDGITYCLDSTPQAVEVKSIQLRNEGMNGRREKNHNEESFTIDSSNSVGIRLGPQIRRLTPLECERLQGFPDNWTKWGFAYPHKKEISDTQRYKCLGNAVTVNVIEAIIKAMADQWG